jgi:hypothetical protein
VHRTRAFVFFLGHPRCSSPPPSAAHASVDLSTSRQIIWFLATSAWLVVFFPLIAHLLALAKPPTRAWLGALKLGGLTLAAYLVFPLVFVALNACDSGMWTLGDDFMSNFPNVHYNPVLLLPFMGLCGAVTADVMSDDGLLRSALLRSAMLLVCLVWFLAEVFLWKDEVALVYELWGRPVAAIAVPFLLQPSRVFSARGANALMDGAVGRTLLGLAPYSTGFYAWQVPRRDVASPGPSRSTPPSPSHLDHPLSCEVKLSRSRVLSRRGSSPTWTWWRCARPCSLRTSPP